MALTLRPSSALRICLTCPRAGGGPAGGGRFSHQRQAAGHRGSPVLTGAAGDRQVAGPLPITVRGRRGPGRVRRWTVRPAGVIVWRLPASPGGVVSMLVHRSRHRRTHRAATAVATLLIGGLYLAALGLVGADSATA